MLVHITAGDLPDRQTDRECSKTCSLPWTPSCRRDHSRCSARQTDRQTGSVVRLVACLGLPPVGECRAVELKEIFLERFLVWRKLQLSIKWCKRVKLHPTNRHNMHVKPPVGFTQRRQTGHVRYSSAAGANASTCMATSEWLDYLRSVLTSSSTADLGFQLVLPLVFESCIFFMCWIFCFSLLWVSRLADWSQRGTDRQMDRHRHTKRDM